MRTSTGMKSLLPMSSAGMKLGLWRKGTLLSLIFFLVLSGLSATASAASPAGSSQPLTAIIDIDYAVRSSSFGVALAKDGTVWYWHGTGSATRGPHVDGAIQVTTGLLLKKDGTVWRWQEGSNTVTQVEGLTGITEISSSDIGNVALEKSGKLWAWGRSCQVALATSSEHRDDVCASFSLAMEQGYFYLLEKPAVVASGVIDADIGQDLALLQQDGLVSQNYMGDNVHYGAYGYRLPGSLRPIAISENSGTDNRGSVFILASDGSLWLGSWGSNPERLGTGTFKTLSGGSGDQTYLLALDAAGRVQGFAKSFENNVNRTVTAKLQGLSGIRKVAAGPVNGGIALDSQGQVWRWGDIKINYNLSSQKVVLNTSPKLTRVERGITVTWNGDNLPLADVPVMREGALLVPMRELFEAFGAKVQYDNGKIVAKNDTHVIELTVYSHNAVIDGKKTVMSGTTTYVNGKTYVPLRFLSQALGAKVQWDSQAANASITLPAPS